MSIASPREEAFVINVPLKPAQFPVVSIDGRQQSVTQEPGKVYLFDLTSRNEVSLGTTFESVRIHLTKTALDNLSYEKGLTGAGGLRASCLGQDDTVLYRLVQVVLPAIFNPQEVSAAFLEYVTLALHEHVIHRYGGCRRPVRVPGGLAPWQLRRTEELVRADLTGDLSISDLASTCGLSASYFVAREEHLSH